MIPFPVARLTDMHTCPMVTVLVPHVGGPIVGPGFPGMLVGGIPVACVGDVVTCVGPPDAIAPPGAPNFLIAGRPVARVTGMTVHGGVIVGPGSPQMVIT